MLKFVLSLVVPIASRGAQNRLGWCSKSPWLVLKIASAGAQNRFGWCWNLRFLWWSQLQALVLEIASAGAQNRLGWCSKWPWLVLKKSPRLVVNFVFPLVFFSCTLWPNHIWFFCLLCVALKTMPFFWFKVYLDDRLGCKYLVFFKARTCPWIFQPTNQARCEIKITPKIDT